MHIFNFQVADETPVYLRGGFGDRIFFGATTILIAGGVAMSLQTLWRLVFKDA